MEWDPAQLFNMDILPAQNPVALLLLNNPINQLAYEKLASIASFTVCADGGANRFYELMLQKGRVNDELPDVIIGDLDAITPEVREHYSSRGVEVIEYRDDNSTDFTKALSLLSSRANSIAAHAATASSSSSLSREKSLAAQQNGDNDNGTGIRSDHHNNHNDSAVTPPPLDVVILGSMGGRMDQALAQLRMLHLTSLAPRDSPVYQTGRVFMVSEWNISFVLGAGRHAIYTVPKRSVLFFRQQQKQQENEKNNNDNNHHHYQNKTHQRRGSAIVDPTSPNHRAYLSESVGLIPLARGGSGSGGGSTTMSTRGLQWDVTHWKTEFLGRMSTSNHVRAEVVEVETDAPILFTVELAEGLRAGRW